jgi:ribonuclease HII
LRLHGACRHHRKFFSPVAATFAIEDADAAAFAMADAAAEGVALTVAVS